MNTLYFTSLTLCIVLTIYLVTWTNIKARVIELSLIVLSIISIINTIACTAICSWRNGILPTVSGSNTVPVINLK